MDNIIACNLGSYRKFRHIAYQHLESIGVRNVEIGLPPLNKVDEVIGELRSHGLTATSLMAPCKLQDVNVVSDFETTLEIADKMGAKIVFVSVRTDNHDRDTIYLRLREIGEKAAPSGIKVCLETHPDMAHNGDVALETMLGVNHSNVCINFDTGNVYYYNHNVTASGELEKIIDHVGAVHLKDTDGGYETWNFPGLGEGIVDFTEVFRILNKNGFYGPFTMELEGIRGEQIDESGVQARVKNSLEHLRNIKAMT